MPFTIATVDVQVIDGGTGIKIDILHNRKIGVEITSNGYEFYAPSQVELIELYKNIFRKSKSQT